jgi:hypothetical protein
MKRNRDPRTRLAKWGFGKPKQPKLIFLRNPGLHVTLDPLLN